MPYPAAIRKTYIYQDSNSSSDTLAPMFLKPNWRILTIGDGDLSFSASLWNRFKPAQLTATVFDSQQTLADKYQYHSIGQLNTNANQQVLFGFDVTNPDTWNHLKKHSFDLVIFQFPLVPAFSDPNYFHNMGDISINTLNRLLLRKFLIHCNEFFLDPNGQQLCYITSKDVKPYSEWNMENSLNQGLKHIKYLGSMPFNISDFPGYKIRNVDRDKHVKDTQGITYIWSSKTGNKHDIIKSRGLIAKSHQGEKYCEFCKAGPFVSAGDKSLHERSKKHQLMQQYEDQYARAIET